ncbi:MAG: NAD(+) diphosphatase [Ruminococcus flavefaciens]|nr:NAD(+) diphosphatase [Ruminococcus flavefaciens]MCM1229229.1 NAD(+) diphosphatase [Ruminococcus flavefaciens]
MIQDISPSVLDNKYIDKKYPDPDSIIFHFDGTSVLCGNNPQKPFPCFAELTLPDNLIFLFSIDGRDYFLLRDTAVTVPDGFGYADIKQFRRRDGIPRAEIYALATAYHLALWYSESRYCGYCGGQTVTDSRERAVKCTFCGKIIYPRINPAVIVGVTDGDRLLITRYTSSRGVNHDALIAGFTEIGETLEQTVEREVMEEVGLKVRNIRYYKSQPWGYSGGILMGFWCDVDGGTEITLDRTELSRADWTERSEIVGQPDDLSLTNDMMMTFKAGRN